MKPESDLWLQLAKEDEQTAQVLWHNKRYSAAVFYSQQAIEKLLKAYIIEYHDHVPEKTHRIERLLADAKLTVPSELQNVGVELSKAYIRVRYPDLIQAHLSKREIVAPLITNAQELYQWISNQFLVQ